MAEGRLPAFAVDRVCAKAQVSRGLVTHHFGGMADLLAASDTHVYARAIPDAQTLPQGAARLPALLDGLFDPAQFNRPALNMWLTLWGAIANTPELGAEHRRQYPAYCQLVAQTLSDEAARRGRTIQADALAKSLICLCRWPGVAALHRPRPAARRSGAAGVRRLSDPASWADLTRIASSKVAQTTTDQKHFRGQAASPASPAPWPLQLNRRARPRAHRGWPSFLACAGSGRGGSPPASPTSSGRNHRGRTPSRLAG